MKQLFFYLFTFAMLHVSAQGLQFNQVRLFPMQVTITNTNYPEALQTVTVPAGKVLKIESAIASTSFSSGSNGTDGRIALDNRLIWVGDNSSFAVINRFPIWLPAGTYTLRLFKDCTSCSTSGAPVLNGLVSAVEFNVVP